MTMGPNSIYVLMPACFFFFSRGFLNLKKKPPPAPVPWVVGCTPRPRQRARLLLHDCPSAKAPPPQALVAGQGPFPPGVPSGGPRLSGARAQPEPALQMPSPGSGFGLTLPKPSPAEGRPVSGLAGRRGTSGTCVTELEAQTPPPRQTEAHTGLTEMTFTVI